MKRSLLSILLALAMLLTLLPGSALADGDVYTVTLSPGEGSGQPITYSSANQTEFPNWYGYSATGFCLDDDGSMMFHFDPDVCPSGWTAPEEYYVFDGFLGAVIFNSLSSLNTTFTAQWKFDVEALPDASFSLSAAGIRLADFDADGYALLTITADSLVLGKFIDSENNYQRADSLHAEFYSGSLSNGTASLPYQLYNLVHGGSGSSMGSDYHPDGSQPLSIKIDRSDLDAAASGNYTGSLNYTSRWHSVSDDYYAGPSGSIPLTLTVPEQTTEYAVTVNNGTADKAAAAAGETVTVTANAPASGQRFKAWTGADGLTFTSGSAATAEATFTMPAQAVTVTATYEDIPEPPATATPTPTTKPTAAPSASASASPDATPKPTATTKPTTKPTATPKPTAAPDPATVKKVQAKKTVKLKAPKVKKAKYQWYVRANESAAWKSLGKKGRKQTLSVKATTAKNGYQYRCQVKTGTGETYSDIYELYVYTQLKIKKQPKWGKARKVGSRVTLTIKATGADSYQWMTRPNGSAAWTPIDGATGTKYVVNVEAGMAGRQFACRVTGRQGTRMSKAAKVKLAKGK